MPTAVREYLYAFLMLATAVLLIVGVVAFYGAVSVSAYLLAVGILGTAALAFVGARYLKPQRAAQDIEALADYMSGKRNHGKETQGGN